MTRSWDAAVSDHEINRETEVQPRHGESISDVTLLDALSQGVVILDADGALLACNEAVLRILGITAEQLRTSPRCDPPWRFLDEEERPLPEDQILFHAARTDAGDVRGRLLWAVNDTTGDRRRLRVDILPRTPPTGGRPWTYIIVEDITEQFHTYERLRRSESRFRKVFEILPVGLWIADKDGTLLSGNPAGVRIWGAEPHVGQEEYGVFRAWRLPSGEEIAPDDWALAHTVNEGVTVVDELLEIEAFDGTRKLILNYTAPVLDDRGRVEGAIVVNQDVTARVRAEEELRAREAELSALFNTIGSGVFLMDAQATITMANDALADLFGVPSGTLVGRSYYDFLREADIPAAAEAIRKGVEGSMVAERVVRHFRRADGTTFLGELRGSRMTAPDGSFRALVGVLNDITAVKAAEEAQLELERRLLHAQKLESLGVLAGGIAHDFNNLLMAVLGNLDLALMDLSPVHVARPAIEEALRATRRASDLTRQMLAYSGRGQLQTRMINLSELVEENASMFRAAIARNVTFNLRVEPEVPLITADPAQMQQVVMNLITNASEAVGDRPGMVTLSTGTRFCDAELLSRSRVEEKPPPGVFVLLEVADTGVGMDAETQARLFDPFFTTKFTGRGLGMSAVLGIVRGHGGAIIVESTPGEGSCIQVLLPAETAPPAGTSSGRGAPLNAAVPGEEPRPRPSGTVLIVDDEDFVRDLAVRAIRRLGYDTLAASDGEQAVQTYAEHAAEIVAVVLDLTMPRMDGLATLRELRRLDASVKVILSSGYDELDVGRRARGERIDGFVQKPYGLRQLADELERVTRGT